MNKVAVPAVRSCNSAGIVHFSSASLAKISTVAIFLCAAVFAISSRAEDALVQSPVNANELAAEVVQNELKAQDEDRSLWRYTEFHQEDGKMQMFEVVQTEQGEVHRLLAVNGKRLAGDDRRREEQRLVKILSDPEDFREKQKSRAHDAEQSKKLMQLLPRAFVYEYSGVEDGFIKLRFTPNPAFHPSSHESEVFHHMEGVMWVDRRQRRLAELDGKLVSPVKFWNGLLGHLDAGGTFCVKQRNVGGGHWEMTFLDVQMDGKALFFKTIAVRQKEIDSDFHPLPGGTTLKQAAEILKIDTAS
jgi:hypothetical protein